MSVRLNTFLIFLCVLSLAAWLRAPFIRSGLPYFYDEDEGHHYNRVVNMVKRGDFNPHYFLKPSLHFYIRMPVTALGFLQSVRSGEVRSLKEVVTKDSFGLAEYSFSASQPKIAKYNRVCSVVFSLATVVLTGVLALQLGLSGIATLGAALIVAVSPALVTSSAVIGVDVIVAPLVLLAIALSISAFNKRNKNQLLLAAVIAGLAASTKYNAAIVVGVPIFAAALASWWGVAALCVLISMLAFLAATPYLLVELPLFLDHVAYEIWHYGIAGHVGHEGQPGWSQAQYYLDWFNVSGVGTAVLVLIGVAIVGFMLRFLAKSSSRYSLAPVAIGSLFAVLYFVFMCSQKANFTRNMLVLVPFLALGAMSGAQQLGKLSARWNLMIQRILVATCVLPLLIFGTLPARSQALNISESRLLAAEWLEKFAAGKRVAVAGELQFAAVSWAPDMSVSKFAIADAETAATEADIVILPAGSSLKAPGWSTIATFDGDTMPMRIVKNPAMVVWGRHS